MTERHEATETQVVKALGSIGLATLASRVLGFVRDMVVALVFGAGPVTDAFFVAFRIPNMLRRLLAEGALSTAAIPVFSEYLINRSRPELIRMLRSVLGAALIGLAATSVLGVVFAPWLVPLIAPGFSADPRHLALAVLLTRVMFPYLVLVGLAALAMGVLNAEGRFFAPALGPAVLNVCMIGSVLGLAGRLEPPILAMPIGVLVGGVAQLLVQVPDLQRLGLCVRPSSELRHPALARVLRLLGPSVFGLAAVQVTVFVNTLLASLLPAGSISFLYYADRVMEFPLGVFGIALASASLPAMSRQAAAGDTRGVANTLNFALRLSFWIAVPAMVGLVVLRTPITRVLFERGRFSPADTEATAIALAWYALGIAGFSASRIAAQAFYAVAEPGTAVRMGVISVAANVVAALALMAPLRHGGLALASSLAAYVNLLALTVAARRRFGRIGGRALAISLARTLAAAAPLALICTLALSLWPTDARGVVQAAWLVLAMGVGVAIYWAASVALGASEPRTLVALVTRRRA